ncbi:mobilization protein [Campylobacter concisus]|uniref:mobilization protein n=1 Tax=Campylobacter concisus TaxID=199 RepID=UPI000CD9E06F|nr:mobilization protein [Campylobacter concisus]
MDNNAKSCFRIDPMKSEFAYWHDFRQGFQASNVQGERTKDNEYSCTFAEARARAKQMKDEADAAYRARTGRAPSYNAESIYWEATVNLRDFHTREDVEKVVKILEKRLGYRTVFWTRHRDEGHLATDDEMDELGLSSGDQRPFILNDHVHIAMFSLDEGGNSLHRRNFGKPNLISQIQTEIAQALGMERGISKKITKRTHLSPRQYRQAMSLQEPLQVKLGEAKKDLAEAKKQIKELERQLKEANKQARAELQQQGGKREDYAALEQENRLLKNELAELKKMPADVNVDDEMAKIVERIQKIKNSKRVVTEAETEFANLKNSFGILDRDKVYAFVSEAVALGYAAHEQIRSYMPVLNDVERYKAEAAQATNLKDNKIAKAFFGGIVSKPDVDVDAIKKENEGLLKTLDSLQKQNELLQKTLKDTVGLVKQKDAQIAELQKNQEGFGVTANDHFYLGQATLLSELINSKKLCIEPKGHSLLLGLDSIISGEYPPANFEGIKSGLLSYVPRISQPENGLSL